MTNPTFVQQLFKTPLMKLQYFKKDPLVTLKYQLQMNNQSTIKHMTENTLVHNVAHTYHPEKHELFPLYNYDTPT